MALLQNVIQRGTHASRPAAGSAGVQYFETDTGQLFRDSGSAWQLDDTTILYTAKGQLLASSASAAVGALAAGTDGYVLTADSAQTLGIKWAAAAATSCVGCKAYNSTTQSINNTTAAVTFDSEEFDTNAIHDTSSATSRLVIPSGKDGKWLFMGGTFFSASGNWVGFKKNGTTNVRGFHSATGSWYSQVTAIASLVATDYIELLATTSGNVTAGHASAIDAQSWAAAIYLGS